MTSRFCVFVALVIFSFAALSNGYSTSGNKIIGPTGNPILLRGVDRCSLEWSATGESLSLGDYQNMASWGANVVRLSLNQCFWAANTNSYQSTVDQQVTWIKSLGLGVILDLHWSNQGNPSVTCAQQNIFDALSSTFWEQVATKYANDPWIIFELYNEPHDVSWSVWLSGGDTGAGFTTPGFQSLYNTVRATGANNLVLIGGLNWAYDLTGLENGYAVKGTNIGYTVHPYENSGKDPTDWPTYFGFALPNYPIVATEFGDYTCDTSYYSSFISYANTNSFSWTAWAWYPGGCSFPALINDWTGAPNTVGALVQASLLHDSKVPSSGSAATVATSTSAKGTTSTSTTTAKSSTSTSTTAHSSSTSGSSGPSTGGITVNVNSGTNEYYFAVNSFSNAAQTVSDVSALDSASGATWVPLTWESWGAWQWSPNRIIVPPISLLLTSSQGVQVELVNVVTSINGGGTYQSGAQFA